MAEPQRLQKLLAQQGLASRRQVEAWILAGRVRVNGKVVSKLPDSDCFAVQCGLSVALQLASQPRASGVVYNTPKALRATVGERPLPVP
jgi:16S rRNA U516 pseudouridylate synthase RsuA-like enzyme